jgi:hypothetical protein
MVSIQQSNSRLSGVVNRQFSLMCQTDTAGANYSHTPRFRQLNRSVCRTTVNYKDLRRMLSQDDVKQLADVAFFVQSADRNGQWQNGVSAHEAAPRLSKYSA